METWSQDPSEECDGPLRPGARSPGQGGKGLAPRPAPCPGSPRHAGRMTGPEHSPWSPGPGRKAFGGRGARRPMSSPETPLLSSEPMTPNPPLACFPPNHTQGTVSRPSPHGWGKAHLPPSEPNRKQDEGHLGPSSCRETAPWACRTRGAGSGVHRETTPSLPSLPLTARRSPGSRVPVLCLGLSTAAHARRSRGRWARGGQVGKGRARDMEPPVDPRPEPRKTKHEASGSLPGHTHVQPAWATCTQAAQLHTPPGPPKAGEPAAALEDHRPARRGSQEQAGCRPEGGGGR